MPPINVTRNTMEVHLPGVDELKVVENYSNMFLPKGTVLKYSEGGTGTVGEGQAVAFRYGDIPWYWFTGIGDKIDRMFSLLSKPLLATWERTELNKCFPGEGEVVKAGENGKTCKRLLRGEISSFINDLYLLWAMDIDPRRITVNSNDEILVGKISRFSDEGWYSNV